MSPEIVAAPLAEKAEFWAMYQRYAHELAPMANIAPVNGEIPSPDFDDFWEKPKHWPLWAFAGGKRVGFALIQFLPEDDAMRVAQFYIAPEHRRGGLGLAFARALFARHPGPWRMREMAANTGAVAFWRKAAAPFGYSETTYIDKGIGRVEQTFIV